MGFSETVLNGYNYAMFIGVFMNFCTRYFLYAMYGVSIGTVLSSYAMITILNKNNWSSLGLQVAIDADPDIAQVPGNSKDIPLVKHAVTQFNRLPIPPLNRAVINTVANQLLHLRLASCNHERNSQIMVTVINEVEIQVNDMGEEDILVERDLNIVNCTSDTVHVELQYNVLMTDFSNSRQGRHEHIDYPGIPWRRRIEGKRLDLVSADAAAKQDESSSERGSANYLFKVPLMSYTDSRGELRASCLKNWDCSIVWQFDSLLPLTGASTRLEIRDGRPVKKILALACALHPRLGRYSKAHIISPDILAKIGQLLPREPYCVASVLECTKVPAKGHYS